MAIKLKISSADPEEARLIERYWAQDEIGGFVEKVNALLPFRNITKSAMLAGFIRQHCQAVDENQRCPQCGEGIVINSRSEAKKFPLIATKPCAACQYALDEAKRAAQAKMEAELQRQLRIRTAAVASWTVDYGAIPDDMALLLRALDRAIEPRLSNGTFTRGDCRGLSPYYVDNFIDQLWQAGVILDDPGRSPPNAYFLRNEELLLQSNLATYFLVPDGGGGAGEHVLEKLLGRTYGDHSSLLPLWLDYAVADCMAYFFGQCDLYGLSISADDEGEIKSIIRVALRTYSISQVWSLAWKVIKDVSSLASREYYNKQRAATTLPGKLRRHLESIRKDLKPVKQWDRPERQPAGTLGQLFYELFGLDEDSLGSDVMAVFSQRDALQATASEVEAKLAQPVRRFMREALSHDVGANVMLRFTELVRSGFDVADAIDEIFGTHPAMAALRLMLD
ncbi:Rossmann-fold NAD(P)-binding domain-containing protein [Metapseudomonas boanensis]|uniref:Uncharacterized protein n=1 Tax=Metapseudomonas boanensis TaxID=2822138 RepID=A0ABS5XB50_9GAMM|nr:hypothetical protein [Pseudomonas boanensis]MBT8764857.1 hypothetical protein [Pseudomonas boanensis]